MSDKEIQMRREIIEMLMDNARKIEKDDQFRYYFGLAKLYVKEELLDEFDEYVISNYKYSNFNKIIKLTAILSHEINNNDDISIYNRLNDLIPTVDSYGLDRVIEIMDNYIVNGENIHSYLFRDTTSNFIQKQRIKLNELSKQNL